MTDPKNSSRWRREKNCRNRLKTQILAERSQETDKLKWDTMCREKAVYDDRETAVYWYFRHVKVESESKFEQDSKWQDALKSI